MWERVVKTTSEFPAWRAGLSCANQEDSAFVFLRQAGCETSASLGTSRVERLMSVCCHFVALPAWLIRDTRHCRNIVTSEEVDLGVRGPRTRYWQTLHMTSASRHGTWRRDEDAMDPARRAILRIRQSIGLPYRQRGYIGAAWHRVSLSHRHQA